ncbi:MAG: CCA tRNA nucleotidyltransferase [Candidatus Omnitrophica bacterium]|nr:CCA tRNA nucleotidyltransferase [Candidatus Omnitrophota bacterium]MCA9432189.1 CCA tRNA nucleotidyltransferase [Candidatus Omnitrophota bacterium]MCB9768143.1 CCA tRNA nucleotidyltransferase [Candidatus Omnitrophota bacterium]
MKLSPKKEPSAVDQSELEAAATDLCRSLQEQGHIAYWAGGAVRDRLLGIPLHDIDVATTAEPTEILSRFKKSVLVGESFGVVRVEHCDHWFEVATFRTDGVYLDGRHPERVTYSKDPKTDAKRRDFTVNALFYDPVADKIHDFVEGRKDLERRLIRCVGDPVQRFREDRLRLLRAIRFAAQIDFEIETETWEAILAEAPNIHEISAERIRDEILRMLVQPRPSRAIRLMSDSGLLKEILPEVEEMKGVEQPPEFHPEGDVFVHTLLMLDLMENPSEELALGVLFHDIGKPETFEVADRIRFNSHDKVGAKIFGQIANRLRLSNERKETVEEMVSQHMRFGAVKKMRPAKLKRFLRREDFPLLLELHRLDCLGSHRDLDLHEFCLEKLAELSEEQLQPEPLVTGHDLINLGYKPGPVFARILNRVEDAQLEGKLQTKADALAFVEERFPARREDP